MNEQRRQHARTDEQRKQSNGNPKKQQLQKRYRSKTRWRKLRMPLIGLLADWTWLKRIDLILSVSPHKPPKLKSKQNKDWEKRSEIGIPKDCGTPAIGVCNLLRMAVSEREEREKGTEEIFETIRTENVPQIYVRHQITDPGSSENTTQDKC